MGAVLKFVITFQTILALCQISSSTPWTFELVDITVENQTPDVMMIDFRKTMVARGKYTVSGQIAINEDLTDVLYVEADVFYSSTGSKNYIRTPFRIMKRTLSEFMNNQYKDLYMKTLQNCTDNLPYFEDTFKPPLTKRLIKFNNCLASTENMPSQMKSGYYRIVCRSFYQSTGLVSIDVKIESNQ